MSFYFPNVDPVYLYQRKNTASDPYIALVEEKTVYKGYTHLKEIPDFQTKVKVRDEEGNYLVEVNKETLESNEFRVDYSVGVVYFYSLMNDKDVTIEYLGTGFIDFPAARIHTDREETLQELINNLDTIKTSWHGVVPNFSDIVVQIPNPQQGDTVQVANTGNYYRFEKGEWVNTQRINDTVVSHLVNRINELETHIDAGSFTDEIDDGTLDGGVF